LKHEYTSGGVCFVWVSECLPIGFFSELQLVSLEMLNINKGAAPTLLVARLNFTHEDHMTHMTTTSLSGVEEGLYASSGEHPELSTDISANMGVEAERSAKIGENAVSNI